MRDLRKAFYTKPLILYLVAALLAVSTFAGPAEAMFLPAAPHQEISGAASASAVRAADIAKIERALESKVVRQKLLDYGLSPEQAMPRVSMLSDEQIKQLATHSESLQAGGDGGDIIVGLIVVALLVVVLVYLLQHRIEIR
jgi:Family of unknown function (DUF6627)